MRATRALIHLGKLRQNLRLIKKLLSQNRAGRPPLVCLAVKADAYGHGAVPVARTALEEGVECLAVACVEEAHDLRQGGITAPLLLLSLPDPDEIPLVFDEKLVPLVADDTYIDIFEREAANRGLRLDVHLKIDTGMGRMGCLPEEAPRLAKRIAASPALRLVGTCTHFPVSDTRDRTFTEKQIEIFKQALRRIVDLGIDPGTVHAANSGAILDYPESHFGMVRPGILAYGYYPSDGQERVLEVRPVMELESRIVALKRVPAGTPISYGCTYLTPTETVIGIVPAGYADGYARLLSNQGRVLVGGELRPVAGRVCMDQFMVDLGPDTKVRLFDPVVLFGPDPRGPSAEEVARFAQTIPYEIMTNINKRVPRVYLQDG